MIQIFTLFPPHYSAAAGKRILVSGMYEAKSDYPRLTPTVYLNHCLHSRQLVQRSDDALLEIARLFSSYGRGRRRKNPLVRYCPFPGRSLFRYRRGFVGCKKDNSMSDFFGSPKRPAGLFYRIKNVRSQGILEMAAGITPFERPPAE